jgi:DnaJ-class molecular chaperone
VHNDIDRDLYEILGVPRNAPVGDIKNAYRAKARECHPDVAQEDPESEYKFKELSFAYEILSDPEKRRTYDSYGLDGLRRGAGVDSDGFGSISFSVPERTSLKATTTSVSMSRPRSLPRRPRCLKVGPKPSPKNMSKRSEIEPKPSESTPAPRRRPSRP